VDNPCNPHAAFTHVKADGSQEMVKFADRREKRQRAFPSFDNGASPSQE
jgi:hypothetical protein